MASWFCKSTREPARKGNLVLTPTLIHALSRGCIWTPHRVGLNLLRGELAVVNSGDLIPHLAYVCQDLHMASPAVILICRLPRLLCPAEQLAQQPLTPMNSCNLMLGQHQCSSAILLGERHGCLLAAQSLTGAWDPGLLEAETPICMRNFIACARQGGMQIDRMLRPVAIKFSHLPSRMAPHPSGNSQKTE